MPDIMEGNGKIETNLKKCSVSQGFDGEFLPFVL